MNFEQLNETALPTVIATPDNYDPTHEYGMVVLMHGFGSHMGDLAGLAPLINKDDFIYICPNAPIPMDIGFGQKGYAWYPIGEESQPEDIDKAVFQLQQTVDFAFTRYRPDQSNIYIGGFSQGGMMTMHAGLTRPDIYKGAIILSSRVTQVDLLTDRIENLDKMPIFMSHGTNDMVISIKDGREAKELLDEYGYQIDYREYPMAHEIREETISDLQDWLSKN
ncbi:MAG TPA: phospholipase [Dehalococcoidia bacterium]|jgi:phospholipase/carboxylesterase|nr:phospholipase [Dehalococcoidia bacterium]